jgi:superfamily II DNA or RNA helicase
MIKITVDNSYSRIEGLTNETFRSLKKALSYEIDPGQAFYQGGHRPRTRSLLDAKGGFPTGLLVRVKVWLVTQGLKATYLIASHPPEESARIGLNLGKIEPYHAQLQAVQDAILQHRGILSMPTGTGKSVVIALLLYAFQVRTLIVVPTLELKKQLTETLREMCPTARFGNIAVENIDSANLKKMTDYDMLIIDEAHHVAASTYQKLNKTAWKDIYYRFFLTATPFRNQTNEHMLFEAIAGQVIFKLSYQEAVAKGYIVPVEGYYIEVPKQKIDGFTLQEVYKEAVTQNETRNQMVADLTRWLEAQGKATLCLVKEIGHGKRLSALSGVPFANGQDEDSRQYIKQFNEGKIKALIGTTGILGEGVDTKPCEYVVVAGLGKAKSAFMQQIGRAVRTFGDKESAKVFLFRDASHKFCLRHFNEQSKVLRDEYGVEPKKIELRGD